MILNNQQSSTQHLRLYPAPQVDKTLLWEAALSNGVLSCSLRRVEKVETGVRGRRLGQGEGARDRGQGAESGTGLDGGCV